MKNLDLYKVIVLLSCVLLPVGYWYCTGIEAEIVACKKAVAEATRQGGTLEQIGGLQKKVELVVQNRLSTSDATNRASTLSVKSWRQPPAKASTATTSASAIRAKNRPCLPTSASAPPTTC